MHLFEAMLGGANVPWYRVFLEPLDSVNMVAYFCDVPLADSFIRIAFSASFTAFPLPVVIEKIYYRWSPQKLRNGGNRCTTACIPM